MVKVLKVLKDFKSWLLVEKRGLGGGGEVAETAEVAVGELGHLAATGGALQEALLDEEGFVDFLDCAGILSYRCADGAETDGTTLELVDDGEQYAVVDLVEAVAVDVEGLKGVACYGEVDAAGATHHGEVAHSAEQRVGYTRRAPAAESDLLRRLFVDADAEQSGGALDDGAEQFVVVVFEVALYAEAGPEGSGEASRAGGRSDEGEGGDCELYRLRAGSFVEEDVDAEVLHGRVEILLDHGVQTVNLVDEEDIVRFERHEYAGQVARFVEHGAGSGLEAYAEFVGDDVGESGLAQTRRAVEECVIESLAAHAGGLDKDREVVDYFLLPGEVAETERAEGFFYIFFRPVGAVLVEPDVEIFCHDAKLAKN